MIVIGIDCATSPKKVGLALGKLVRGKATLIDAALGENHDTLVAKISSWLPAKGPALLALDAPLGWPSALGAALAEHRAGSPLEGRPDDLFRRGTDRYVKRLLGKQPLDVGADRIARTAHAALRLLADLRQRTGHAIPLAWSPDLREGPAAIEVYPAATLIAHDLRAGNYKKPPQARQRREIVRGLSRSLQMKSGTRDLFISNADVLDAAICVLAGCDFIRNRAPSPKNLAEAKREGWIWVARRSH